MLLKSIPSLILETSPRFGAFGVATFLRFSCPALDGNVGNRLVGLGLGFSSKYGCTSTSLADGRLSGSSTSRDLRRSLPAVVRNGNFALIILPDFVECLGRRSDLAFGKRRNPGQDSSVGIPQSSKI